MLDFLDKRVSTLHKIYQLAINFALKYTDTIARHNQSDALKLKNAESYILVIEKLLKPMPKIIHQVLFTFYEIVNKGEEHLIFLREIADDEIYYGKYVNMMSQTAALKVKDEKDKIVVLIDGYLNSINDYDIKLQDKILELFQPNDCFKFINHQFDYQKTTNNYLLMIMKIVYPLCNSSQQLIMRKIIEGVKAFIVGSTLGETSLVKYYTPQCFLHKRGFYPDSFIPITKVIDCITVVNDPHFLDNETYKNELINSDLFEPDVHDTLINLYKTCGFMIIHGYAKTALNFNIKGLISKNYIAKYDLLTKPTEGLNKKIIKRFNTITPLETVEKSYIKVFRKSTQKYVIMETFDGCKTVRLYSLYDKNVHTGDIIHSFVENYNTLENYQLMAYDAMKTYKYKDQQNIISRYKEHKKILPPDETIKRTLVNSMMLAEYATKDNFMEVLCSSRGESAFTLAMLKIDDYKSGSQEENVTFILKVRDIWVAFVSELKKYYDSNKAQMMQKLSEEPLGLVIEYIVENVVKKLLDTKKLLEFELSFKEFIYREKISI